MSDKHSPSSSSKRPAFPPPWTLPRWYRFLAIGVATVLFILTALITFLVWAWRAGEWNAFALYLLFAELAFGIALLIWGRPAFWRLAAFKYGLLSRRTGIFAIALVVAALLAWVMPALLRRGAPESDATGHRVAIVGAGTAGLHAAWMLERAGIDFVVYEAADYLGGHAYAPIYTPETGDPFACDVGFIFGSPTDYQEMKVLMDWYGIERNPSELSMSGSVDGVNWASGPDVSDEAKRFQRLALEQHQEPRWNLVPFGFWLQMNGFSQEFRREYLTPMMSVLFITDLGLYEISTRFMLNMAAGRIQWIDFTKGAPAWTVKGGSVAYYTQLSQSFKGKIKLATPVASITRQGDKVQLEAYGPGGKLSQEVFDDVILAIPGDVAHSLVKDKDWLEDFVLGNVRYRDSEVVLHTDQSLLPDEKHLRHYNYFQDRERYGEEFELTGVMNWVHGAGEMSPRPIGSLNPLRPIDPKKEILRRGWRHHSMDLWHLALMLEVMPTIQGRGGVWYAGDWVTVIGHGPAMRSGMAAACNVGAKSRVKAAKPGARCIDVRTEEERAGLPAVSEHLCGEEEIFAYLVERNCNGFKL